MPCATETVTASELAVAEGSEMDRALPFPAEKVNEDGAKGVFSANACGGGTVLEGAAFPPTVMLNASVSVSVLPVPEFPWSLLVIVSTAVPLKPALGVKVRPFSALLMLYIVPVRVTEAVA